MTKSRKADTPPQLDIDMSTVNVNAGADVDMACNSEEFNKWFKKKDRTAAMTVLEWITSPWHYVTLPYMKKRILFDDGETYSEGCKRCSRPFYEYEHMYSWFPLSPAYTGHYQMGYWCVNGTDKCSNAMAPKPFHDEQFWTNPIGLPVTTTNDNNVLDSDVAGWHNWPTKAFMFGIIPNDKRSTTIW